MNNKKILYFIPALAVMIFIFVMSSMPAVDSDKLSDGILDRVIDDFIKVCDKNLNISSSIYNFLTFLIRKFAHFTEFLLLGICVFAALYKNIEIGRTTLSIIAIEIGIIYAVTDEFHQFFVPGRSCELRDICIDAAGVSIGVLFSLLVLKLYGKKRKRRRSEEAYGSI